MTETTMRQRAVALAEQGFRVFPLKARSKTPVVKAFYDIATSDPVKVAEMWTDAKGCSQDYNIGISTDNLLVLDIDVKDGKKGEESLRELVEAGLTAATAQTVTPTGGRHLIYQLPPNVIAPSMVNWKPGIDIRGWHSYVVGPGSVLDIGEYEYV